MMPEPEIMERMSFLAQSQAAHTSLLQEILTILAEVLSALSAAGVLMKPIAPTATPTVTPGITISTKPSWKKKKKKK